MRNTLCFQACIATVYALYPCILEAFQAAPPARDYAGVSLHVATAAGNFLVGDEIPVTVSLRNSTNASKQVLTLDSALLEFSLDVRWTDGRTATLGLNPTGGDTTLVRSGAPGTPGLIKTIQVPQQAVQLAPNAELRAMRNLTALNSEHFFRAGSYQLKVRYDHTLEAETKFAVEFRPDRDIPKLIALFETAQPGSGERQFAADYLGQLTIGLGPLRLEYYPRPEDPPALTRRQAGELRAWWTKNREQLEYRSGRLQKKAGDAKQ